MPFNQKFIPEVNLSICRKTNMKTVVPQNQMIYEGKIFVVLLTNRQADMYIFIFYLLCKSNSH